MNKHIKSPCKRCGFFTCEESTMCSKYQRWLLTYRDNYLERKIEKQIKESFKKVANE